MRPRALTVLRLALALSSILEPSCKREEKSPPAGARSAKPPTNTPPTVPAQAPHEPAAAPELPPLAAVPPLQSARCRVLRAKGTVKTAAGSTLGAMTPVDGDEWLEFATDSELVVRHSTSARELLLRGPGRMLPCRGGQEQVLIESGSLKSTPGTGVRPGAELWIGTPFGIARYGDAGFELIVSKTEWKVAVQNGSVWTDPPLAAHGRSTSPSNGQRSQTNDRAAEGRINAGERASARANPNPELLVGACGKLAEEAKTAAERVASNAPGLGERAAAHLVLRRKARAACLSAAAAAHRAGDAQRSRLEDQIRAADAMWEKVPVPSASREVAHEPPP